MLAIVRMRMHAKFRAPMRVSEPVHVQWHRVPTSLLACRAEQFAFDSRRDATGAVKFELWWVCVRARARACVRCVCVVYIEHKTHTRQGVDFRICGCFE